MVRRISFSTVNENYLVRILAHCSNTSRVCSDHNVVQNNGVVWPFIPNSGIAHCPFQAFSGVLSSIHSSAAFKIKKLQIKCQLKKQRLWISTTATTSISTDTLGQSAHAISLVDAPCWTLDAYLMYTVTLTHITT